ncbi:MAG: hypothetical protein RL839_10775 [Gammaproteobacteria bacterium]
MEDRARQGCRARAPMGETERFASEARSDRRTTPIYDRRLGRVYGESPQPYPAFVPIGTQLFHGVHGSAR